MTKALTLLLCLCLTETFALKYGFRELNTHRIREKFKARSVLSRNIDNNERPPGLENLDDPINIDVSMYLLDLRFCPHKQQLTAGGYFRQFWTDKRFYAPGGALFEKDDPFTLFQFRDMFDQDVVWIPDTFAVNAKTSLLHPTDAKIGGRSFLRVKSDGSILTSFRFQSDFTCPTPKGAEEVTCSFTFESFVHKDDSMAYSWKSGDASFLVSDAAKETLKNQGWELVSAEPSISNVVTSVGKYSGVTVAVHLKRI